MTDLDALIADNRRWVRLHRENKFQREAASRMARVLDELEDAEAALAQERRVKELYKGHARKALADRDAALAVIENVRGLVEMWEWIPERGDVLEALSSVPADVLRERDRRVQAEALREAADDIGATFADPDRRRPKHPKAEVATDYVNDAQWAELIVRERAARIEQNSEGNET